MRVFGVCVNWPEQCYKNDRLSRMTVTVYNCRPNGRFLQFVRQLPIAIVVAKQLREYIHVV